jgi:hypothetical protein
MHVILPIQSKVIEFSVPLMEMQWNLMAFVVFWHRRVMLQPAYRTLPVMESEGRLSLICEQVANVSLFKVMIFQIFESSAHIKAFML